MGKLTGKKRKLNYTPIFLVGGIALPIIVVFTLVVWPKPPELLLIESVGPESKAVSSRGTVRINWQTNLDSHGTLFYRLRGEGQFGEIGAAFGKIHSVSVLAKPGQTIEYHVIAEVGRQKVRSNTEKFTAQPGND